MQEAWVFLLGPTHTHRRTHAFWLVLAHRLSAHRLPLFPRQLITPIESPCRSWQPHKESSPLGKTAPKHSFTLFPNYHLIRTKHVFLYLPHTSSCQASVFLLCRFIKRIMEKLLYPHQVLGREDLLLRDISCFAFPSTPSPTLYLMDYKCKPAVYESFFYPVAKFGFFPPPASLRITLSSPVSTLPTLTTIKIAQTLSVTSETFPLVSLTFLFPHSNPLYSDLSKMQT